MKRIFLILSLFAVMANLYATDVISVIRQKGWLETAMLQWTPVEGAAKYSVSYSGEGVSGNADDMLIRTYPDYVRCDILRHVRQDDDTWYQPQIGRTFYGCGISSASRWA